ncbi:MULTISPECIES: glycosyltransferase family 4 protein [Bizionia]|uniref:Glycosyltransferase family 4 protein n=1 Tax=Bizionia algoritergicola TaxID=291187 RepID=A0A5D0QXS7_9FLAO|nr:MULTISPECIES: glycosyltransferase family 4 protein [Bizionia]OBX23998.1 glycosyl transferase family 1 [Bizionia sp. APA-3]TYB73506.1 glycosyltransferase family 4 protein [Bizionia algoritergicola]
MVLNVKQTSVRKKVLIVTYYWPPAGGPGVQRWLKFVKYLPDFNIEPIVYIPENPNYPIVDNSLLSEIPDSVTIIKQPISEPYKLAGLFSKKKTKTISKGIITNDDKQTALEQILLFIRGNFFIPDARKSWVKPSVAYLSSYIKTQEIDTIITTGPPHSLHLIGLELKKKLNLNWLADFRDPWTTIGYHKQLKLTKSAENKHKQLEQDVLRSADRIIVTSYVTKAEFKEKTNKPISVITNGYDANHITKPELDSQFTLAHIGSLLSKRNPEILWQALSDLIVEKPSFATDFKLNLVGFVSEDVLQSMDSYDLSDYINEVGYVSHEEAVRFQKKSQVLLLIEIDSPDTRCIIPGKLFEYMVSERPTIAIGPEGSDVATILKETNTGSYFKYDDYNALKKQIELYYESFKKGSLHSHGIGLQKYSRKALTKSLSELL